MTIRSIEHPSVQISETDLSLIAPNFQMTTVLIPGFSHTGEDLVPTFISNMSSYQTIFGKPTTDAERYAYYATREVLNNHGNVYFTRMPYNNIARGNFRAFGFDIDAVDISGSTPVSNVFDVELSGARVRRIEVDAESGFITEDELDILRTSNDFSEVSNYSTKDFLIVNASRHALEGQNENEGVAVVVLPGYNALAYQNQFATWFDAASAPFEAWAMFAGMITPSSVVDSDNRVISGNSDWVLRPGPGSSYTLDSISKDLSREFPWFQIDSTGGMSRRLTNCLTVLVLKTYVDINSGSLLNYQLVEKYLGTLGRNDKDPATGLSVFLGDLINAKSNYIEMYYNPDRDGSVFQPGKATDAIARVYSVYQNDRMTEEGTSFASTIIWPTLSFSKAETEKSIKVSDILTSLESVFTKMSNIDERRLDVVVDAGLSNNAQFIFNHQGADPEETNLYQPDQWSISDRISSKFDLEYWQTVADMLNNFCKDTRKDCMAIIDSPRALALEGNEKVVRASRPQNNIDKDILPKVNFITGLNTSYGAGYITWHRRIDQFTGLGYWEPPTIKAIGRYCNVDLNFNFWEAPYGLERGVLSEITDISFSPHSKQEDQIYLRNWNYTKEFPLDGFVLWGQKTFQSAPSAFDRINVRRLFLKLERLSYDVSRHFVGVINNYYNRTRLLSVLDPKFSNVQRLGGMYDYRLICDETNNTAEVIDNNELKLAVMIKPARVADFILINFYALRTGATFEEVIL